VLEIEVAPGLESIAAGEAARIMGPRLVGGIRSVQAGSGGLQLAYRGPLEHTDRLKSAVAVYLVLGFDVPRPKALLGHQHLQKLLEGISRVRAVRPADAFQSYYLSAAGRESSVLRRLREEIGSSTGLEESEQGGDLLIRLRRTPKGRQGWQVLLRLTPRPLSARAWRRCDFPGALNASVAHAMALMGGPVREGEVYLNLGCGSGTLIIEQLSRGSQGVTVGCDLDPEVLACAGENLLAFGKERAPLLRADICQLPLASGTVEALAADLPFGGLVGSHRENLELYPALLEEAGRVARPGARFLLITHEVRLMESVLRASAYWTIEVVLPINLSGLHPRIYKLRRLG
jgi:23S rRNA G2445 N2-methylase RlmL